MTGVQTVPDANVLPDAASVLAVCAHPDDESFGLGAVLAQFTEAGSLTSVLCFTHGEASTLGADVPELGRVRETELADAARELGVSEVELLHYPDGVLSAESLEELTMRIREHVARARADLLLVFDEGGITGHPDHRRATEAAVAVGEGLDVPVLAWALPDGVTEALNREFAAAFVGRSVVELDVVVPVDRRKQHRAISRHASQAPDNPVLRRRLELQGNVEVLRWLWAPRP